MKVEGCGVFLTGGASGIGKAALSAFLSKGARVLFCDVNIEQGQATQQECQNQYGANCVRFKQCDVTDAQSLEETFQAAVSWLGKVDVCVNNAGIMDERIWEKMIAINTIGQIRGCKLALEHMRRDKGGKGGVIINTVSMSGLVQTYWHPVYNASKHAVIGFTQSWAYHPEMQEMGVRWACVCPGAVRTELALLEDGKVLRREDFQTIIDKTSNPIEEVAAAFIQLVEDDTSNAAILTVTSARGRVYRQRRLVDASDGESNPQRADEFRVI